jgi:hypothetical protein
MYVCKCFSKASDYPNHVFKPGNVYVDAEVVKARELIALLKKRKSQQVDYSPTMSPGEGKSLKKRPSSSSSSYASSSQADSTGHDENDEDVEEEEEEEVEDEDDEEGDDDDPKYAAGMLSSNNINKKSEEADTNTKLV